MCFFVFLFFVFLFVVFFFFFFFFVVHRPVFILIKHEELVSKGIDLHTSRRPRDFGHHLRFKKPPLEPRTQKLRSIVVQIAHKNLLVCPGFPAESSTLSEKKVCLCVAVKRRRMHMNREGGWRERA